MPSLFDPIQEKKSFLEFTLGFMVDQKYDVNKPMGSFAKSDINFSIYASLVGLHEQVAPFMKRAVAWIDDALVRGERCGTHHYYLMQLHEAKALALWLQSADPAEAVWVEAARCNLLAPAEDPAGFPKSSVTRDMLDDYVAFAYQAGQYEAGVAEFEKHHGAKKPSLKGVPAPRTLGYALCLNKLHVQFDPDDLFKAGQRLLEDKLEDAWLGRGQSIRTATWLKAIYWQRDPTLSPLNTLLKAYDHMPQVKRPEWITFSP